MAFAGLFLGGELHIHYTDDKENTRVVKIPIPQSVFTEDGATLNAAVLKTVMLAAAEAYDNVSDAVVEKITAHINCVDVEVDTTSQLLEGSVGTVEQIATLDFQRSDGKPWSTTIRGPKNNTALEAAGANIFNPDGSIDEQDSMVAAMIAMLIDKMTWPGVGAVTVTLAEYVGGYFVPSVFQPARYGTEPEHED